MARRREPEDRVVPDLDPDKAVALLTKQLGTLEELAKLRHNDPQVDRCSEGNR